MKVKGKGGAATSKEKMMMKNMGGKEMMPASESALSPKDKFLQMIAEKKAKGKKK